MFDEAATGNFSDCRCELLNSGDNFDDEELELEFELVLKVYSVVWKPTACVLLEPIHLEPIEIAEAKLRGQEEELANLRLSLKAATEELESARCMKAKALFLVGSSRELKKYGLLQWEPCEGEAKSMHFGVCKSGWIRFHFAGAYRAELLVRFPHDPNSKFSQLSVRGGVFVVEQHHRSGVLKRKWKVQLNGTVCCHSIVISTESGEELLVRSQVDAEVRSRSTLALVLID